jgi:hypothetical protein
LGNLLEKWSKDQILSLTPVISEMIPMNCKKEVREIMFEVIRRIETKFEIRWFSQSKN